MKKLLFGLLMFMMIINVKAAPALGEKAKSAVLMEASTGEIIFNKNSHEKLHPASMTKMMSMLLIVEAIENGNIKWDEMVTVSENASSMGGSQILLETNEKMSVSDLFKGIAIASGNDAVVALAEKIAGTEADFVSMMNKRAKELKMSDTNFKNPHGLDATNHYSSAYDMALLARELVKHEKVLEFTKIYEDYLRENTDRKIWLVNTNRLVRFYDGVDGLKTGFTEEAGYCLTATAKKDDMRLIAVVMGEENSKTRNGEVTAMLDYGFAKYEVIDLLGKKSLDTYKVDKAKEKIVNIVPKEPVTILQKKNEEGKYKYSVKVDNIKAPIKKGNTVGKVIIKDGNKTVRTIDLTIDKDVSKANLWDLYLRYLKEMISGNIIFK